MRLLNGGGPLWRGALRAVAADVPAGPTDLPPAAVDDQATVPAGGTVAIPVLANDADPEGGALTIVAAEAVAGGVAVAGDALSYTAPAGFAGTDTVTYRVADPAGNTAEARVAVEVTAAAPPFAETGVRFDGSQRLVRNVDLGPADSGSLLHFVSFVPGGGGREGILRQSSIYNGIEIWDGYLQFAVSSAGSNVFLRSRLLPAGARVHVLAGATPTGADETALGLHTRFAGEAGWTQEAAEAGPGELDLTFGGFTVGGRHGVAQTNHNLRATVYRIACWAGSAPPITTAAEAAAVADALLAADGTLRDPAVSHGLWGVPRVDLYGPPGDYAAGVNHGSAGGFDTVEGTFGAV